MDIEHQKVEEILDSLMASESSAGESLAPASSTTSNLESQMDKLVVSEEKDDTRANKTCDDVKINEMDAKQKKKLDKLADSIIKKNGQQMASMSTEAKYYLMIQKFMEMQEQNKKLQLASKEVEKSVVGYVKQRDQIQSDYTKACLAKNKLESLCRELQKHNKLIKEENLERMKEEEERRKEISAKFQSAIEEINVQVNANSEKNNALIQENAQLNGKLKNILEQYEAREQQIEKILKHKDLENQLANAKFQQSELKLAECNERAKCEKTIYENTFLEQNKKIEFHQDAEKQLRAQLAVYTEKYEEFQSTLKKSNQVFESFRTEMDKMSKKIKKLEQETASWKNKYEGCDKTLQNALKQKEEFESNCKKLSVKADMMEKLSRTLQTERNELKDKLKRYQTTAESSMQLCDKIDESKTIVESSSSSSSSSNEEPSSNNQVDNQVEATAPEAQIQTEESTAAAAADGIPALEETKEQ